MFIDNVVRVKLFVALTALLAGGASAAAPSTENYPTRPVRFIVAQTTGGNADFVGRLIAESLGKRLGQQFVVDNRAGASGIIATEITVKAVPDGHTLLLVTTSFSVNPGLYKKLPYDADKDFRAVTKISNAQLVLLAPKTSPFNTVKELIAEARLKPGVLTYSSAGSGSTTQLCSALFNAMAGTDITHIPYKSGGQALTDLIGGQVSTTFVAVASAMSQVKAGSVRALGVSGLSRSRSMPDVPTISEAGVPNYELVSWSGALVRAGTPDAIVARLNASMVKIASKPDFQSRLQGLGVEPDLMPTDVFAARIVKEIPYWAKVAQSAGVTPE
jgi:tripartite-type tricarboxylate transporter receptor subunit TctC